MSTLTKTTIPAASQLEETAGKVRGRPRCEDSRKRILEAAAEVMVEDGFANATTDGIAERAGASKATIYRWWPNKAALLAEALRVAVGQELPFPHTGDFQHDVRKQLRNFTALINGPRGKSFRAFVSAASTDPEVANAFRVEWVQPRREEAKAVLDRYRRSGALAADQDLDLILDAMYGPFYFRLLTGEERIPASYADAVADLTLKGAWVRSANGASPDARND